MVGSGDRADKYLEGRRITLSFLTICLVILAAFAVVFVRAGRWLVFVAVALAVLSIITYVIYLRTSFQIYTESHPRNGRHDISEDRDGVIEAIPRIERMLTRNHVNVIFDALTKPVSLVDRITESVYPLRRSTFIKSSFTYSLSEDQASESLILPVGVYPRGELLDGLKIYGPNDARLSSLTRTDSIACIAAMIRLLVFLSVDSNQEYIDRYEDQVIRMLCATEPVSLKDVTTITEGLASLSADQSRQARLSQTAILLRALRTVYPVFVAVSASEHFGIGRVRLKVLIERRLIADLRDQDKRGQRGLIAWGFGRLRDNVRKFLGVPPAVISVPLANVARCHSYHLEVKGPENTYLARQRVIRVTSGYEVGLDGMALAFRRRRGQRHVHLYVRHADALRDCVFQAYFYERVPGSVGLASAASLGSAALIVVAAMTWFGFGRSGTSDLVAVLLAFPSVAGAWVGFDNSQQQIGGALAARVSSLLTTLLSVTAALVYVLAPRLAPHASVVHSAVFWCWFVVTVGSVINALGTTGSWLMRSAVQAHLVSRLDYETETTSKSEETAISENHAKIATDEVSEERKFSA